MDPIFERLGQLFRSTLGSSTRSFEDDLRSHRHADPDLRSAMQDLDDFLNDGPGSRASGEEAARPGDGPGERGPGTGAISPELKKDFATLNVAPGATPAEVKRAYRLLLRAYHPDRFAADAEKMKTATEISSRINQAYQRIEAWFDRT
jgi:DnaJ-domain-containing protein 1